MLHLKDINKTLSERFHIQCLSSIKKYAIPVTHITVMENLAVEKWAVGGEFLLTSQSTFPETSQDQIDLIEVLCEYKIAALAIKPQDDQWCLEDAVIQKANESKLPVFLIPKDVTYVEIMSYLNVLLTNAREYNDFRERAAFNIMMSKGHCDASIIDPDEYDTTLDFNLYDYKQSDIASLYDLIEVMDESSLDSSLADGTVTQTIYRLVYSSLRDDLTLDAGMIIPDPVEDVPLTPLEPSTPKDPQPEVPENPDTDGTGPEIPVIPNPVETPEEMQPDLPATGLTLESLSVQSGLMILLGFFLVLKSKLLKRKSD